MRESRLKRDGRLRMDRWMDDWQPVRAGARQIAKRAAVSLVSPRNVKLVARGAGALKLRPKSRGIDTPGKAMERAKGIEPSYAAWEAAVLPLNYARKSMT